jgi:hypothetical protein
MDFIFLGCFALFIILSEAYHRTGRKATPPRRYPLPPSIARKRIDIL